MSEDNQKSDDKVTETIVDNKANRALLDEKKRLEADLQKYKEAEAQREADEATKKGEWEKLEKKLRDEHAKELAKRDALIADRDNSLKTLSVDNAIKSEMAKHNVRAEFTPAVEAMLKSMAKYDNGLASINDKSIEEFTAEFFASKDGLHYVRAAENSGSGALGSNAKAPVMTAENWNNTTFLQLAASNPAEARAIAIAAGKPEVADRIK